MGDTGDRRLCDGICAVPGGVAKYRLWSFVDWVCSIALVQLLVQRVRGWAF